MTEKRVTWDELNTHMTDMVADKGIKIYVKDELAPMKAVTIGNWSSLFFVNVNSEEIKHIAGDSKGDDWFEMHAAHANEALKDADPERFEGMKKALLGLKKAYEDNGVTVIQYGLDSVPQNLEDMYMSASEQKFLSGYGKPGVPFVFGKHLLQTHEVTLTLPAIHLHLPVIKQLLSEPQNKDSAWLTMPIPQIDNTRQVSHWMSPGDPRLMPGNRILIGMGVDDPAKMRPGGPRSGADEPGIEMLRRMVEPYGFSVHTFFYNSSYSPHHDGVMFYVEEGLYATTEDMIWPDQENLPKELTEWERITITPEEARLGACNSMALGSKRAIVTSSAPKLIEELEKRGHSVTPVDFAVGWETYLSGVMCCSMAMWRE